MYVNGHAIRDIMRLATSEAMLFKFGSGTGTNFSALRSSRELLRGGGEPSGTNDAVAAICFGSGP